MNATIPEPEVVKKYFTVEEANNSLPLVKLIVRDIVELHGAIQARQERLDALEKSRSKLVTGDDIFSDELEEMEASVAKDAKRLKEYIAELTALGIELKDPAIGLVDFPSQHEGREVYLCWKYGEEEVGFWHELEEGFDGRKAV